MIATRMKLLNSEVVTNCLRFVEFSERRRKAALNVSDVIIMVLWNSVDTGERRCLDRFEYHRQKEVVIMFNLRDLSL